MNKYVVAALIVGVIAALIWFNHTLIQGDKNEIQQWGTDNGHIIVEIEQKIFSLGPFWFKGKTDRVYKVTTKKSTYWFRFRLGGPDIEEYNE